MDQKWQLLVVLHLTVVAADLQVYPKVDPFIIMADFLDQEANFGMEIPTKGLSTMLVAAEPADGCAPIARPPAIPIPANYYWAVLIRRNNCTFEQKVLNAQNASYDVVIVHNVDSNKLEIMNASDPDKISIVSIFITANAGRELRTKYLYDQGYVVRIDPNTSGDILRKILIPFIIIISACFVLLIGFMVVKCIKDRRRNRRRRLPYSSLNQIPTSKFRKNDPFETCAICLDDFIVGEKLRILPCSHAYHCKCIDPWLTRNRRVCPMCKRKVLTAGERLDSDDSSSEDDDHTPLMRGRNAQSTTTYGTRTNEDIGELLIGSLFQPMGESSQQVLVAAQHPGNSNLLENDARRAAHVRQMLSDIEARRQLSLGARVSQLLPRLGRSRFVDANGSDSDSGHSDDGFFDVAPAAIDLPDGAHPNNDHHRDEDHHRDDEHHRDEDHHRDDDHHQDYDHHRDDDHHQDYDHHRDDDHHQDYDHHHDDYSSHDVDHSHSYDC